MLRFTVCHFVPQCRLILQISNGKLISTLKLENSQFARIRFHSVSHDRSNMNDAAQRNDRNRRDWRERTDIKMARGRWRTPRCQYRRRL